MLTSAIGAPSSSTPPLDRSVFPVTRRWAYCDHAAVGPLPQPARDAVVAALDAQMSDGCKGIADVEARTETVRGAVAHAIGAVADEIAFMRSTSDGALVVSNGLDWRSGDEVLTTDNEFGANAYPWLNLASAGVSTVMVHAPGERLTIETLERMVTPRTRVVAVSYVGFSDGYRHDIAALGGWCREHGVLFAVDAMQGFGHLPLDVVACKIDVCYFGVAKWLLSPQGLSVVFARKEIAQRLKPALCSWRSVREPMRFLEYGQEFAAAARRFDAATLNYPALTGFAQSLALITGAGLDRIERHVLHLNERVVAGAQRAGLPIVSDLTTKVRSGIVVIGRGKRSVQELLQRTSAAGVQATIRESGIRIAPHGYNNEEDIDRVLEAIT